ncbi:MAG TPA: ADOP family duplicated permease [Thermoanaerobaculia bacterium]|jgi:putative ABC transport system permease protein|nr:ADOP family duplicated permease [Thermoanaerobaculia bacterium]
MRQLARSLATALRSFARQPGMVAIVVLTLALGIGASTALFAYLAAIVWPTLDAPEPERVVWMNVGSADDPRALASYPDYIDLRRQQTAVRNLVGFSNFAASVGHNQSAEFAWGQMVSGDYFSFFGARPQLGRLLQPADDQPGAEPVAVVSHRYWKRTLGGDPKAIGRPLRLNGRLFTLVGVLPEDFQGHGRTTPLYVPLAQTDRITALPRLENRERRWVILLGRLAPGITLDQARKALDLTAESLDNAMPLADGRRRIGVMLAIAYDSGYEENSFLTAGRVLMAAALLFLLLACANVANLLLARAAVKQREWGIRASLGASRRRLTAGVLAESLILCLAGGAAGLAFAVWMARRIDSYLLTAPGGLGDWSEANEIVRLDFRAFTFTLGIALLCGLLCGLAPALRVLRGDLLATIKSDAAGSSGPSGALVPRKLLVIAQVGLSVLLLLGGSLLVRTLRAAEHVNPGFDPGKLLLVSLYVPRSVGALEEGASAVYKRAVEEAATVPGVESVTLAHVVPLAGWARQARVASAERPDAAVDTAYNLVAPDYFATVGIPILQGRALDRRDRRDATPSVVVSRALAAKLWGNVNPVGRLLSIPDPPAHPGEPGPVFEVAGVAQDVRVATVVETPGPLLYLPLEQRSHARLTLIVRTAAPPASLAPGLRRALRAAHPDLSVVDVVTCGEQMRRSLAQQRMHAEVAGLFALLGLGVAVVGLFGLLSYTVSLRVREFGIRIAIGANPANVELLVLRQGMGLVAVGLVLGLAGALALTRLLKSLLFGVAANDPVTFVAVAAGLTLVTLVACYLPAHRAAQLDPLAALREAAR